MSALHTSSCRGRVVKALDSKSNGVSPHRFESCRQRIFFQKYFALVSCCKCYKSMSITCAMDVEIRFLDLGTKQVWWCRMNAVSLCPMNHTLLIAPPLASPGSGSMPPLSARSLCPGSCGLMDKAPDFGSGDCRFESCHGRSFLPFIPPFIPPNIGMERYILRNY